MSKSIYDEALVLIENIDRNLPYTWLVGRDNLMKIKQALEQAKKQEKLLELYIDLANTIEVLENAYGYGIFEFGEIKYISNKIKELGND